MQITLKGNSGGKNSEETVKVESPTWTKIGELLIKLLEVCIQKVEESKQMNEIRLERKRKHQYLHGFLELLVIYEDRDQLAVCSWCDKLIVTIPSDKRRCGRNPGTALSEYQTNKE